MFQEIWRLLRARRNPQTDRSRGFLRAVHILIHCWSMIPIHIHSYSTTVPLPNSSKKSKSIKKCHVTTLTCFSSSAGQVGACEGSLGTLHCTQGSWNLASHTVNSHCFPQHLKEVTRPHVRPGMPHPIPWFRSYLPATRLRAAVPHKGAAAIPHIHHSSTPFPEVHGRDPPASDPTLLPQPNPWPCQAPRSGTPTRALGSSRLPDVAPPQHLGPSPAGRPPCATPPGPSAAWRSSCAQGIPRRPGGARRWNAASDPRGPSWAEAAASSNSWPRPRGHWIGPIESSCPWAWPARVFGICGGSHAQQVLEVRFSDPHGAEDPKYMKSYIHDVWSYTNLSVFLLALLWNSLSLSPWVSVATHRITHLYLAAVISIVFGREVENIWKPLMTHFPHNLHLGASRTRPTCFHGGAAKNMIRTLTAVAKISTAGAV